eukprot:746704-Hanusia_phi.AAC.1
MVSKTSLRGMPGISHYCCMRHLASEDSRCSNSHEEAEARKVQKCLLHTNQCNFANGIHSKHMPYDAFKQSSAYEELSDLLSQARRASYSRSNVYTCGLCGASSSSSERCDCCGVTSPSSLPDPRAQVNQRVQALPCDSRGSGSGTSLRFTPCTRLPPPWIVSGTMLSYESGSRHLACKRCVQVHKNHISRDVHNKRVQLDIEAGNQQVWSAVTLGQVEEIDRDDAVYAKEDRLEKRAIKSLKEKRDEVSMLRSEIAARELELRKLKEVLQQAEMELQNETLSIASQSVRPSHPERLEDKLSICRLCGCHTMSCLRCDACGSDLQGLSPSEASHSGITKIYTMHKHGSTTLSKKDIHSLVHLRHFSSDPSVELRSDTKLSERTVEEWEVLVRQELQLVRAHLQEGREPQGKRQRRTNFTFGVFSSVETHEAVAANTSMVDTFMNEDKSHGMSLQRTRKNIADLRFFVSHLKACAKRMRSEAERAAVIIRELEVKTDKVRPQDKRERTFPRPTPRVPVRCMCCGCDSLSVDRCDCCGGDCCGLSSKEVFPHEAQMQRKSSIFGVYTMHGSTATQLDQEDRHNLVHTNHFSQVEVDSSPFLERELQAPADQARWGLRSAGKPLWSCTSSVSLRIGRSEKTARDKEAELKEACKSCVELEEAMLMKDPKVINDAQHGCGG